MAQPTQNNDFLALRLEFVHRQKEFMNAKTFSNFEKLQVALFALMGTCLLALSTDYSIPTAKDDLLIRAVQSFLIFILVVYVFISVVNIYHWIQYDNEEDKILGRAVTTVSASRIVVWPETWFIVFAVIEFLIAMRTVPIFF